MGREITRMWTRARACVSLSVYVRVKGEQERGDRLCFSRFK